MVVFDIPHPMHTFTPESCPHFALKCRILAFRKEKCHIPKNLFGTLEKGGLKISQASCGITTIGF